MIVGIDLAEVGVTVGGGVRGRLMIMKRLLLPGLPIAVGIAAWWVRRQERMILAEGELLEGGDLADARLMGVEQPERIRVLLVDEIRGPGPAPLRQVARLAGMFGPNLSGISYRYGILIRRDCHPDRYLLAHECVHTGQYEQLGGLRPFLRAYFRECLLTGYPDGPLERQAIERARALARG